MNYRKKESIAVMLEMKLCLLYFIDLFNNMYSSKTVFSINLSDHDELQILNTENLKHNNLKRSHLVRIKVIPDGHRNL